jgi:hypothetical protein
VGERSEKDRINAQIARSIGQSMRQQNKPWIILFLLILGFKIAVYVFFAIKHGSWHVPLNMFSVALLGFLLGQIWRGK